MTRLFETPRLLLTIAGVTLAAIVLVLVIGRLTAGRPESSHADDQMHGRCAVARQAVDAFDRGKPPPAEWIQDRAAAAEAVRTCDRP